MSNSKIRETKPNVTKTKMRVPACPTQHIQRMAKAARGTVTNKKDDLSALDETGCPIIPSSWEGLVLAVDGPTDAPIGKIDAFPHRINKQSGHNFLAHATNENRAH